MSEKQSYLYHVVYQYAGAGRNGIASLTMELDEKITSSKSVLELKEFIEREQKFDNVVITNWKELESW